MATRPLQLSVYWGPGEDRAVARLATQTLAAGTRSNRQPPGASRRSDPRRRTARRPAASTRVVNKPASAIRDKVKRWTDSLKKVKTGVRANDQPIALPLLQLLKLGNRQIPPELQLQAENYGIYLVRYGVDIDPVRGEKPSSLDLRLDYDGNLLSLDLFPRSRVEKIRGGHATVQVGVNAKGEFGLPEIPLPQGIKVAGGGSVSADAGWIFSWEHNVIRARIACQGIRSQYARWTVNDPEAIFTGFEVAAVIRAPARAKRLAFRVSGGLVVKKTRWPDWRGTRLTIEPCRAVARVATGTHT